MTKPIVSVAINLMSGGDPIVVSDATAPGVGGAVAAALIAGQDLHFNNGEAEYIIPFHAVAFASIARTTQEAEAPVDALCVAE